MKTVILCGGRGFRLQEETEYRPKPLVAIGGRPILWHIMRIYARYGFREFVLCLGYRGDMIKEYFLNYDTMSDDLTIHLGRQQSITYESSHNERDFHVTLVDTGLETMTGGRLKRVEKYVQEETFLLTYGDGLSNVNIKDLLEYHHSHGRCATVTSVHPVSRWGVIEVEKNGKVLGFAEKPVTNDWVSAGFFVFNKKIFDYLGDDGCILEEEPLQRLAREGQLMAFKHNDFFFPMDTYRDYKHLNGLWDTGQAPWIK